LLFDVFNEATEASNGSLSFFPFLSLI